MDPNNQQYAPPSGQPTVAPAGPYASAYPPQAGSAYGQTPGLPPGPANTPPLNAPHLKSNPNSTQNTLQIAEIRDGIVIMNDGSFRSVVMVKSSTLT